VAKLSEEDFCTSITPDDNLCLEDFNAPSSGYIARFVLNQSFPCKLQK